MKKTIIGIICILLLIIGWNLLFKNDHSVIISNMVQKQIDKKVNSESKQDMKKESPKKKKSEDNIIKRNVEIIKQNIKGKQISTFFKSYEPKVDITVGNQFHTEKKEQNVIKVDPLRFIIENNVIVGITEEGLNAIKSSGKIDIPEGIIGIGKSVFAHLNLKSVLLPSTLQEIGEDCFFDNQLSAIQIPSRVTKIGRGAFDYNNLSEVVLTNPECTIDAIFYNSKYVNIISANPNIQDVSYLNTTIPYQRAELDEKKIKAFGSVKNKATINVKYFDAEDKIEFETPLVSKRRNSRYLRTEDDFSKYYYIGETINVVSLKNDYLHLGNTEIEASIHSEVEFHYNDEEVDLPLKELDKSPYFNGINQPILIIIGSINAQNYDYKKGVYASDYQMKDITQNIKVLNVDEIDVNKAGVYDVKFEVIDQEGNRATASRKVYVEEETKWYPHDFYYDEDIVIGLSKIGEYKLNEILTDSTKKIIELPIINMQNKKVTTIGAAAFARLRIRGLTIPDGYKEIRPYAFDSTLLEELELPDSIETVGERAFAFTEITDLKLSSHLKVIESRAFASSNLKEIILPESIIEIGEGAFMNNSKLKKKEIIIPQTVKVIRANTFENCRLVKLNLQEGLEEIHDNAFGKNDLKEVKYLPKSLVKLDPAAFKQNGISNIGTRFEAVKLYTKDGKNPHHFVSNAYQVINPSDKPKVAEAYVESDFIVINGEIKFTATGVAKAKLNKDLIIPDTVNGNKVTSIANIAFMAKGFKSLKLANYLETIGDSAFYLNEFEEITFPDSVKEIGGSSFYANKKLKKITLSKNLEKIGKNAFIQSQLTRVELPESIKEIGLDAFKRKNTSTKVVLVIQYNENTKEFISKNKNRTDFKLEVIGAPKEDLETKEVILQNTVTKYGIKKGERLIFKIAGLKEKPTIKLNDKVINATRVGEDVYITTYLDAMNQNSEQIFIFTIGDKTYEKKLKFFAPEKIELKNETEKFEYDDGLKIQFKKGQYGFENMKLYSSNTNSKEESSIIFEQNTMIIPKEFIQKNKENDILKVYVEGTYHQKTLLKIRLKESSKIAINFEQQEVIGETYVYIAKQIDEEIFESLQKAYENDEIEVSIARTTFIKNYAEDKEALSEDEYMMEFNNAEHSLMFAICKPIAWESLTLQFARQIFSFEIDDKMNLTVQ